MKLNTLQMEWARTFMMQSEENRLKEVMGLKPNENVLGIMYYALMRDPNMDVRFAALKRVHLFSEYQEIMKALKELGTDEIVAKLEPHYSTACYQVGFMNKKELRKRIHRG